MTISSQNITDNALESLEWDYQQDNLTTLDRALESVSDYIFEAIGLALVYTSDIRDYWVADGCPEPEELGQTISDSIVYAVAESLRENVSDQDVIDAFLESHAGTLETLDTDSSDTEQAFNALVEYRATL